MTNLIGGFADASFVSRLRSPAEPVPFSVAVAFGIAAGAAHSGKPKDTAIQGVRR